MSFELKFLKRSNKKKLTKSNNLNKKVVDKDGTKGILVKQVGQMCFVQTENKELRVYDKHNLNFTGSKETIHGMPLNLYLKRGNT